MVAAVIVVVGTFLLIGGALEIKSLVAGFMFLLYWAAIKHADFGEFVPALLGPPGDWRPAGWCTRHPAPSGPQASSPRCR